MHVPSTSNFSLYLHVSNKIILRYFFSTNLYVVVISAFVKVAYPFGCSNNKYSHFWKGEPGFLHKKSTSFGEIYLKFTVILFKHGWYHFSFTKTERQWIVQITKPWSCSPICSTTFPAFNGSTTQTSSFWSVGIAVTTETVANCWDGIVAVRIWPDIG